MTPQLVSYHFDVAGKTFEEIQTKATDLAREFFPENNPPELTFVVRRDFWANGAFEGYHAVVAAKGHV